MAFKPTLERSVMHSSFLKPCGKTDFKFKLLQPPYLFFGIPDDTEAINHFIGDEFGEAAADFGVVQVVVTFAVFGISGQFRGQLFRLVQRLLISARRVAGVITFSIG